MIEAFEAGAVSHHVIEGEGSFWSLFPHDKEVLEVLKLPPHFREHPVEIESPEKGREYRPHRLGPPQDRGDLRLPEFRAHNGHQDPGLFTGQSGQTQRNTVVKLTEDHLILLYTQVQESGSDPMNDLHPFRPGHPEPGIHQGLIIRVQISISLPEVHGELIGPKALFHIVTDHRLRISFNLSHGVHH